MCGATAVMRQCAVLGVDVVAEAYALMRLCFLVVSACGENGHSSSASAVMSLEVVHPGFAIAASAADELWWGRDVEARPGNESLLSRTSGAHCGATTRSAGPRNAIPRSGPRGGPVCR